MEDEASPVERLLRELAKAEADRAAELEERLTAQYNLTSGLARHLTKLHEGTDEKVAQLVDATQAAPTAPAEPAPPPAPAAPPVDVTALTAEVTDLVKALAQRIAKQHEQAYTELAAKIDAQTPDELLRRLAEVVEVVNGRHDELAVLLAKSIATDPTPKLVEIAELMINQHRQTGSRIADLAERLPGDPAHQIADLGKRIPADPAPQIAELTRLAERITVQQADTEQRIADLAAATPPDPAPQIAALAKRLAGNLDETRALLAEVAAVSARQVDDIKGLWDTPLRVDTRELELGQTQVGAAHAQDIAEVRRDLMVLLNAVRQRDDELIQLRRDVAWLVGQLGGA